MEHESWLRGVLWHVPLTELGEDAWSIAARPVDKPEQEHCGKKSLRILHWK